MCNTCEHDETCVQVAKVTALMEGRGRIIVIKGLLAREGHSFGETCGGTVLCPIHALLTCAWMEVGGATCYF